MVTCSGLVIEDVCRKIRNLHIFQPFYLDTPADRTTNTCDMLRDNDNAGIVCTEANINEKPEKFPSFVNHSLRV